MFNDSFQSIPDAQYLAQIYYQLTSARHFEGKQ